MKISYVYFPEKEKAAFAEEELDTNLTGSQVLVKSEYDLISAGTELANYHDLPNTTRGMVINHKFPHYPGYTLSGHVVKTGPEVKSLKPGDKVAMHWCGHRSWVLTEEAELFRLPDDFDMKTAAFTHLASFPFLGVRKLQIQLGESVMVAGLGLLGLIAVQLAKLSGGYPVLACDFSEERRQLALQLGADYALDPREPDFIQKVCDLTDGGVNAVVEVTGYLSGLQQALEYTARFGRISILGCTRISDQPINVYQYIHCKGIQLIGAHTSTRPEVDSYPGYWTCKDDYRTFVKLVQTGKLNVAPLYSRIESPHDAEQIYRLLGFEKNPPLGILFDWTGIDPE